MKYTILLLAGLFALGITCCTTDVNGTKSSFSDKGDSVDSTTVKKAQIIDTPDNTITYHFEPPAG